MALVLSRKIGEIIDIGPDVSVVVVEIRGDKVRLGVEAPREIVVHRREVTRAIELEKSQAKEGCRGVQAD